MQKGFQFLLVAFFLAGVGGLALAAKPEPATHRNAEIIADEAAGVVRIMIHGKEVAHFDEYGLHVTDDIVSTTGGFFYKASPKEGNSGGEVSPRNR